MMVLMTSLKHCWLIKMLNGHTIHIMRLKTQCADQNREKAEEDDYDDDDLVK